MRRGKGGGKNMEAKEEYLTLTTTNKGAFISYMVLPELTLHYSQVLP